MMFWYEKVGIAGGLAIGITLIVLAVYLGIRMVQKKRP